MATTGATPSSRWLPIAALTATLAACQPSAPPAQDGETATGDTAPATPASPDELAPGERINYQCGDLAVGATFDEQSESMRLSFSGQRLELPIAVSASGARYADDAGNEFWGKGMEDATLTLAGEERRDCVRSHRASPWDVAADNGVAFRAVGQEPNWLVEVEAGEGDQPASLTAHLDYGQRLLEAGDLQREGDAWSGLATDGTSVELTVEERDCADVMSGERFRAAATLVVGDEQYQGCGAWLSTD